MARLNRGEEGDDLGHERRQRRNSVTLSPQGYDRDVTPGKILPVLDAFIRCQQYIESRLGDVQQTAVFDTFPALPSQPCC